MRILLTCALPLAVSCATAQYTGTTESPVKPRADDCEFAIKSAAPADGQWEEIGVVNIDPARTGTEVGTIAPGTPGELRELIGADVCRGGGELVVGEVDDLGQYIRGTVYRRTGDAVALAGCSYDTQCKGDRICDAGRCVSP